MANKYIYILWSVISLIHYTAYAKQQAHDSKPQRARARRKPRNLTHTANAEIDTLPQQPKTPTNVPVYLEDAVGELNGKDSYEFRPADAAHASSTHKRYRVRNKLKEGGQGIVYVVCESDSGVEMILKQSSFSSEQVRKQWLNEVTSHGLVNDHPSVVRMYHHSDINVVAEGRVQYAYILMEYVRSGDLIDQLSGGKQVNERRAIDGMIAVMKLQSPLAKLNSRGWLHNDVSAKNVLWTDELDAEGFPILKLCDFGAATNENQTRITCNPSYISYSLYEAIVYGRDTQRLSGALVDGYAIAVNVILWYQTLCDVQWVGDGQRAETAGQRNILCESISLAQFPIMKVREIAEMIGPPGQWQLGVWHKREETMERCLDTIKQTMRELEQNKRKTQRDILYDEYLQHSLNVAEILSAMIKREFDSWSQVQVGIEVLKGWKKINFP